MQGLCSGFHQRDRKLQQCLTAERRRRDHDEGTYNKQGFKLPVSHKDYRERHTIAHNVNRDI
jgi:hypothetical protein